MKKRYRVLRTFGLERQGMFVEGTEVQVKVGKKRAGWKGVFMTPQREQELLAEERIELVKVIEEVKRGKI